MSQSPWTTLPRHLLSTLGLPLQCLVCRQLSGPLCQRCQPLLNRLRAPRPGLSLAPFRAVQAPWCYGFPLDQMINGFKHRQQLSLLRLWQTMLAIPPPWQEELDAVIPVPLHWQRQWWRGYNQAGLLARMLCRQHRLPLLQPLTKTSRSHQQGRSRAQRLYRQESTFTVTGEVQGKHLLVVDDVITTGATLRTIGYSLLEANAASVRALALCQVPDQANSAG